MNDASTTDSKADRIKAKIDASQARNKGKAPPRTAARASDYRPTRANFFDKAVDEHPLALLAGGIVVGAIVAAVLPRSFGAKVGRRAVALGTLAAELGSVYGTKALDAASDGARAGQDRLEDLGETIADQSADARRKAAEIGAVASKRAVELGSVAGKRAAELASVAAKNATRAGESALKAIGDLSERVRH